MIAGEAPGGVAAAESGDDRSISSYGDDLYNGFLKIMRNEVNMYKRAVTAYESSAIRSIVDVTLAVWHLPGKKHQRALTSGTLVCRHNQHRSVRRVIVLPKQHDRIHD